MQQTILQPVAVLAAWTMVMLGWMVVTRLPAMSRAGVRLSSLTGTNAADADRGLPREAQWKAHNYNHLMEQPTVFYAVALLLALAGAGNGAATTLAWIYVGFRIAHSLWQATVNKVLVRFWLFAGSSAALVGLILLALAAVF